MSHEDASRPALFALAGLFSSEEQSPAPLPPPAAPSPCAIAVRPMGDLDTITVAAEHKDDPSAAAVSPPADEADGGFPTEAANSLAAPTQRATDGARAQTSGCQGAPGNPTTQLPEPQQTANPFQDTGAASLLPLKRKLSSGMMDPGNHDPVRDSPSPPQRPRLDPSQATDQHAEPYQHVQEPQPLTRASSPQHPDVAAPSSPSCPLREVPAHSAPLAAALPQLPGGQYPTSSQTSQQQQQRQQQQQQSPSPEQTCQPTLAPVPVLPMPPVQGRDSSGDESMPATQQQSHASQENWSSVPPAGTSDEDGVDSCEAQHPAQEKDLWTKLSATSLRFAAPPGEIHSHDHLKEALARLQLAAQELPDAKVSDVTPWITMTEPLLDFSRSDAYSRHLSVGHLCCHILLTQQRCLTADAQESVGKLAELFALVAEETSAVHMRKAALEQLLPDMPAQDDAFSHLAALDGEGLQMLLQGNEFLLQMDFLPFVEICLTGDHPETCAQLGPPLVSLLRAGMAVSHQTRRQALLVLHIAMSHATRNILEAQPLQWRLLSQLSSLLSPPDAALETLKQLTSAEPSTSELHLGCAGGSSGNLPPDCKHSAVRKSDRVATLALACGLLAVMPRGRWQDVEIAAVAVAGARSVRSLWLEGGAAKQATLIQFTAQALQAAGPRLDSIPGGMRQVLRCWLRAALLPRGWANFDKLTRRLAQCPCLQSLGLAPGLSANNHPLSPQDITAARAALVSRALSALTASPQAAAILSEDNLLDFLLDDFTTVAHQALEVVVAPPDSFRALVTQVAPITATTAVVAAVMQALTVQHVANSSVGGVQASSHVAQLERLPAMVEFVAQWTSHTLNVLQAYGATCTVVGSPSHDVAVKLGLVKGTSSLNNARATLKGPSTPVPFLKPAVAALAVAAAERGQMDGHPPLCRALRRLLTSVLDAVPQGSGASGSSLAAAAVEQLAYVLSPAQHDVAVSGAVRALLDTTVARLLKPVILRPLQPTGGPVKQQAAENAAVAALVLVRELFTSSTGGVRHDGVLARRVLCHLLNPLGFDWLHTATAPEAVREQVLRLLAVLLQLPSSVGLIPPFTAHVGEMPAGRVDFERIMPLRDSRTLTDDCFTAAATAFMHLTCVGVATCVQRAVHDAATCMDPVQQALTARFTSTVHVAERQLFHQLGYPPDTSSFTCHLADLPEPYTLPAVKTPAPAPAADQQLKSALAALHVVAALALSEVPSGKQWARYCMGHVRAARKYGVPFPTLDQKCAEVDNSLTIEAEVGDVTQLAMGSICHLNGVLQQPPQGIEGREADAKLLRLHERTCRGGNGRGCCALIVLYLKPGVGSRVSDIMQLQADLADIFPDEDLRLPPRTGVLLCATNLRVGKRGKAQLMHTSQHNTTHFHFHQYVDLPDHSLPPASSPPVSAMEASPLLPKARGVSSPPRTQPPPQLSSQQHALPTPLPPPPSPQKQQETGPPAIPPPSAANISQQAAVPSGTSAGDAAAGGAASVLQWSQDPLDHCTPEQLATLDALTQSAARVQPSQCSSSPETHLGANKLQSPEVVHAPQPAAAAESVDKRLPQPQDESALAHTGEPADAHLAPDGPAPCTTTASEELFQPQEQRELPLSVQAIPETQLSVFTMPPPLPSQPPTVATPQEDHNETRTSQAVSPQRSVMALSMRESEIATLPASQIMLTPMPRRYPPPPSSLTFQQQQQQQHTQPSQCNHPCQQQHTVAASASTLSESLEVSQSDQRPRHHKQQQAQQWTQPAVVPRLREPIQIPQHMHDAVIVGLCSGGFTLRVARQGLRCALRELRPGCSRTAVEEKAVAMCQLVARRSAVAAAAVPPSMPHPPQRGN